jgi:hypothetical protein
MTATAAVIGEEKISSFETVFTVSAHEFTYGDLGGQCTDKLDYLLASGIPLKL